MADIKYLPQEPPVPEVAGGRTRESVLVDLAQWPAISRRRDLNERLYARTCAVDAGEQQPRFGPEDVDLLLLITRERFGAGSALLRKQAVVALGTIDADEAVQRLADLAISPAEVGAIRIAALGALHPDRASDLLGELTEDPSALVRDYARRARGDVTPQRYIRPRPVPQDNTETAGRDEHCR